MSTDLPKETVPTKRYRERAYLPTFGGGAAWHTRVIELAAAERAPDGAKPVAEDEPLSDWKREESEK